MQFSVDLNNCGAAVVVIAIIIAAAAAVLLECGVFSTLFIRCSSLSLPLLFGYNYYVAILFVVCIMFSLFTFFFIENSHLLILCGTHTSNFWVLFWIHKHYWHNNHFFISMMRVCLIFYLFQFKQNSPKKNRNKNCNEQRNHHTQFETLCIYFFILTQFYPSIYPSQFIYF